MHEARVVVGYPPSLHSIVYKRSWRTLLLPRVEKSLCLRGFSNSPPEPEIRVHTKPSLTRCAISAISIRRSPILAFLIPGYLGLTQITLWRIEVAPFLALWSLVHLRKPIITIPISLYRGGMVMMSKKGEPG